MPFAATYAFNDVQCTLNGPGGSISLGAGAANAKEGISIEYLEDKDKMTIGADGSSMHSLIASNAGKIMIRLLKTSPFNGVLYAMYNLQKSSSLYWGSNIIGVANAVTGDSYVCSACAFTKAPRNDYAEEAGLLEWDFNAGSITAVLGANILNLA